MSPAAAHAPDAATRTATPPDAPSPITTFGAAFRASFAVEGRKLLSLTRVKVIFALLIVAPWLVEVFIKGQATLPTDTLFGREMKASGYALPLMLLSFGGSWLLPTIVSIVCGDLFSSENQHGTWKTVLTRSVGRTQIFWAKVLTAAVYCTIATAVLVASCVLAGLAIVGGGYLINLGGLELHGTAALAVVIESWAVALCAIYGFAAMAIFFSILTRSSTLGVLLPIVIGFVMQIFAFIKGADQLRHVLLGSVFVAWHGLADTPTFTSVAWRAIAVSAVYIFVLLGGSYVIFRRRDITGG